jgi:uncharacterized protein (TIGR02391 family)
VACSRGLLAPKNVHGWHFISRRGRRVLQRSQDFSSFLRSNVLPKATLHPVIAERVWSSFVRGEYDIAVLQAFKEVEVAVRAAAQFEDKDIGVPMMRRAFNPTSGPLTDTSLEAGEREAMMSLFSGAIGAFKNPSSHRHVGVSDAHVAAEIIAFASLLMRIVDDRDPTR